MKTLVLAIIGTGVILLFFEWIPTYEYGQVALFILHILFISYGLYQIFIRRILAIFFKIFLGFLVVIWIGFIGMACFVEVMDIENIIVVDCGGEEFFIYQESYLFDVDIVIKKRLSFLPFMQTVEEVQDFWVEDCSCEDGELIIESSRRNNILRLEVN